MARIFSGRIKRIAFEISDYFFGLNWKFGTNNKNCKIIQLNTKIIKFRKGIGLSKKWLNELIKFENKKGNNLSIIFK